MIAQGHRRAFNRSERDALYLEAGGRCEACGVALGEKFEADHVTPYSRGGETDVLNGEALCRDCNRTKGDRMNPYDRWQNKFLGVFERTILKVSGRDFLLNACPGAGKTRAFLRAFLRARERGLSRLVVVVPTEPLKRQVADAAAKHFGLQLDPFYETSLYRTERQGFSGICVTYQQVARNPSVFRAHSSRRPTMVVLDEIHHAEDESSWGKAIREAFEHAAIRLCTTGTPFRTDNRFIPFVRYEADAAGGFHCVTDFDYGYSQAIGDRICRDIVFEKLDGPIEWSADGVGFYVTFKEDLADKEASQRLRCALMESSVPQLLDRGAEFLSRAREKDPKAGALILAMDTVHANQIVKVLADRGICPNPVIVTSEHANASDALSAFRDGSHPWCVAVRMVSEGVDIQRLRVLVYATNWTTPLFFRQAAGRVVRGAGRAWVVMPGDPRLVEHAVAMQKDIEIGLAIQKEEESREDRERETGDGSATSSFVPIGASLSPDGAVVQGEMLEHAEIEQSELLVAEIGGGDPHLLAKALRKRGLSMKAGATSAPAPQPLYESIDAKRKAAHRLVNRVVKMADNKFSHEDINAFLVRRTGSKANSATVEQLSKRIELLEKIISRKVPLSEIARP